MVFGGKVLQRSSAYCSCEGVEIKVGVGVACESDISLLFLEASSQTADQLEAFCP